MLHGRIYVAGHRGLVGSAIVRYLASVGAHDVIVRTHDELDLSCQASVDNFFAFERPDYVFLAAAKVGGIHANSTYPAEFIRDNLAIQTNVVHSAWKHGVRKLLFLGSSCIYPRDCPQPIKEDYLLTGPLEPTNEPYAIAKIAGLRMCQAYRLEHGFNAIVAMPTNLYGPGDNYHPENAHVVPALIRRFHESKLSDSQEIAIWGNGTPMREFMYVDDLAKALVLLMERYSGMEIVNVGSGHEVSIAELASTIATVAGYAGKITFDSSKPNGTPRKLLDSGRMRSLLGPMDMTSLENGLMKTYADYLGNTAKRDVDAGNANTVDDGA
ncbi:GDP-L-fucose synthase [Rhodanobacter sp. 7MK24]|nr:GDP-L-fucose synthase [Rhodanobacter sp. 7MK24]